MNAVLATLILGWQGGTVADGPLPAVEFVKHLGQTDGRSYRVSAALASRVVMACGLALPPDRLRAALATATWGRWQNAGGEWTLGADPKAIGDWKAERTAARVETIRRAQAALPKEAPFDANAASELLKKLEAADRLAADRNIDGVEVAIYEARQKAYVQSPAKAALDRIVAAMNPQDLASLSKGYTVFSNRPTRYQRPLPKAEGALRDLETAQEVWSKAPGEVSVPPERKFESEDPRGHFGSVAKGSLRAIVRAEWLGEGDIQFTAWFVDRAGKPVQYSRLSLGTDREGEISPDLPASPDPVVFSERDVAHAEAMAHHTAAGPVRKEFLDPVRNEPLGFTIADVCRGISGALRTPVVAWLPDRLLGLEVLVGRQEKLRKLGAGEWLKALKEAGVEAIPSDGCLVLRPVPEAFNTDRSAVARLALAANALGFLPLEDLASYAALRGDEEEDELCSTYLDAVLPRPFNRSWRGSWTALVLWGTLTPYEKSTLRSGGAVPWSRLTASQGSRFLKALLRSEPQEFSLINPSWADTILAREPTELLADSQPGDWSIGGGGASEPGVYAVDGRLTTYDVSDLSDFATAAYLARAVVARERRPGEGHLDNLPSVLDAAGYLEGKVEKLTFGVRTAGEVDWIQRIEYGEIDVRQSPVPLASLSQTFRDEYERYLDAYRKSP